MSADRIEQARRHAEWARGRLDSTLGALQQRLHPKTLATEAWDGVRERGNDLADGALQAVRERPAAVSAAVGAFALFLARRPIGRALGRLWQPRPDPDGVIVHVETIDRNHVNYGTAAPRVEMPVKEGVS
jgi:ElaB/YqjD/DUF883 family membrane-anchored ribosome-binding protein